MYSSYDEMTLGQWVGTLLLSSIPVVNIVLLILWAVTAQNMCKKRFAQAMLIVMGIAFVVSFIFMLLFGTALMASPRTSTMMY